VAQRVRLIAVTGGAPVAATLLDLGQIGVAPWRWASAVIVGARRSGSWVIVVRGARGA